MKPCPFCGKQPEYTDYSAQPYFVFPREVACNNPDCLVNPSCAGKSKEDAIGEWNTRPIEDALLYACEYALSVYENITSVGFVSYENKPARDVLRAALAQAKGLVAHEEVSCDNP